MGDIVLKPQTGHNLRRTISGYLNQAMYWQGEWAPGEYAANSVVRDNAWLMISNKKTSDRAAPQPLSDPAWVSDREGGLPPWNTPTANDTVWFTGQRYTFAQATRATSARWYASNASGQYTYEMWLVDLQRGMTDMLSGPFVPAVIGWRQVGIDRLYRTNDVIDLVLVRRATVLPNTTSGFWQTKNENSNPGEGEAVFRNNEQEIRVHNIDKNDVDQRNNLIQVQAGGTFSYAGVVWNITSVDTGNNNRVVYHLEPNQGRPEEDTYTLTWEWGDVSPLPLVEAPNFYSGTSQVQGFSDGAYPPSALDDDAHGLDLEVSDYQLSPDWDLMVHSPA